MSDNILDVKGLKKYFKTKSGMLHAVDDLSFTLERGKTLGIVGESGCGKSTTGRAILRLIEPTAGEVYYDGKDVVRCSQKELRALRKDMQIIFQDPFASLNPRFTTFQTIAQPIKINHILTDKKDIERRVYEIMETVGLSERFVNSYPHELDGGRRQRIVIARALATNPKFIVCDEPVSALDVSIQAQILNLLQRLKDDLGLSYIFITHDLSVVNHFADSIIVMYLGRMVEMAPAEELFKNPIHPYTRALFSAVPVPRLHNRRQRIILKGEISSPIDPPDVCRFASRCNYTCDRCQKSEPVMREVQPNHFVACCRVGEFEE